LEIERRGTDSAADSERGNVNLQARLKLIGYYREKGHTGVYLWLLGKTTYFRAITSFWTRGQIDKTLEEGRKMAQKEKELNL